MRLGYASPHELIVAVPLLVLALAGWVATGTTRAGNVWAIVHPAIALGLVAMVVGWCTAGR